MQSLRWTIVQLPQANSTNSVCLNNRQYMKANGLLLLAHQQTAARGRLGRSWYSHEGALEFSVVWQLARSNSTFLSLGVGYCIQQAIGNLCAVDVSLKWPNDVVYKRRKLCGILCESDGLGGVVIGIGINCWGLAFPDSLAGRMTSIEAITGYRVAKNLLLEEILVQLNRLYSLMHSVETLQILTKWKQVADYQYRQIAYFDGQERKLGQVIGLSQQGGLMVRHDDQSEHELLAGTVDWLD